MQLAHQKAILGAEKDMTECLGVLREGMDYAIVPDFPEYQPWNNVLMSLRTLSLRT